MRRKILYLLVALFSLLALLPVRSGAVDGAQARLWEFELRVSATPDRRGSVALEAAGPLSRTVHIFLAAPPGVRRVRYYLDPPAGAVDMLVNAALPFHTADRPPYDMNGSENGRANGFATGWLLDGAHTIAAAIDMADGRTVVRAARIQVANWIIAVADGSGPYLPAAGYQRPTDVASRPLVQIDQKVACSPAPCGLALVRPPYMLGFDRVRAGLADGEGRGTGFTAVARSSNGDGYVPENLRLDPAGQGVLVIATTPGSLSGAANSQDNAIGVGVDARSEPLLLETVLLDPPVGLGSYEQAGLWFGADEDNHAKLALVSHEEGPRISATLESQGIQTAVVLSPPLRLNNARVGLRLKIDGSRGAVTAYYTINGGATVELGRFAAPASLFHTDRTGATQTDGSGALAGLFTTQGTATKAVAFLFDSFSVRTEPAQQQATSVTRTPSLTRSPATETAAPVLQDVITETPTRRTTATSAATATRRATDVATATRAAGTATRTATPVEALPPNTPTRTATPDEPLPPATQTRPATATRAPTATLVPTAVPTVTPPPTDTPTPVLTATPSPPPSDTSVPPTSLPTTGPLPTEEPSATPGAGVEPTPTKDRGRSGTFVPPPKRTATP